MRDVLRLYELAGPRLELALEQLESGLGFVYRDVWFLKYEGFLMCQAATPWHDDSLTESEALELLTVAQAAFAELSELDRFESVVDALPVRFMVIEDYGMGTAVLAELIEDRLVLRT